MSNHRISEAEVPEQKLIGNEKYFTKGLEFFLFYFHLIGIRVTIILT